MYNDIAHALLNGLGIECSSGLMAERLPQVTSGPSEGMNRINATRQGVQVNILGSNSAAVELPMFIPSKQSRQGGPLGLSCFTALNP